MPSTIGALNDGATASLIARVEAHRMTASSPGDAPESAVCSRRGRIGSGSATTLGVGRRWADRGRVRAASDGRQHQGYSLGWEHACVWHHRPMASHQHRLGEPAHVWHQRLLRSGGRDYPAEQLPPARRVRWLPSPLRASAPPPSPAGVRWRTSSWPPIPTSTSTRSDRSSSSRSPRHVTVGRCLAEGGTEDVRASLTRSRNGSVGLALRQPRMRGGAAQPPTAERSAATQSPRYRKGSI